MGSKPASGCPVPVSAFAYSWSHLGIWQWVLLLIAFTVGVAPYVSAVRYRTSFALATVLSLLLVFLVQFFASILNWMSEGRIDPFPWRLLSGFPAEQWTPLNWHRFVTAAWIHAGVMHVLGNILIVGLVGVPLEQRLGRRRFMALYLIGAFGGNLAWTLANFGDVTFGLGASGAAFGLLGGYLAGWPRDEIEFPLVLIRRWPVSLIALLYFFFEVVRTAGEWYGLAAEDGVAQMAHLGGFLFCYASLRPLARGGPVPVGVIDGGPSAGAQQEAVRRKVRERMAGLEGEDPWSAAGVTLDRGATRVLDRLKSSGDEPETREAWLDQLAERVRCPTCEGALRTVVDQGVPTIECTTDKGHLDWP